MDDAQQQLFTALKLKLEEWNHTVYDGMLPPKGTPYPFDYLGEVQQLDDGVKNALMGTIHQTIHVYSNNVRNRGTFSRMLAECKQACRDVCEEMPRFMLRNISTQVLPDNTTREPLLHGIIDAEFSYS